MVGQGAASRSLPTASGGTRMSEITVKYTEPLAGHRLSRMVGLHPTRETRVEAYDGMTGLLTSKDEVRVSTYDRGVLRPRTSTFQIVGRGANHRVFGAPLDEKAVARDLPRRNWDDANEIARKMVHPGETVVEVRGDAELTRGVWRGAAADLPASLRATVDAARAVGAAHGGTSGLLKVGAVEGALTGLGRLGSVLRG